MEEFKSYNAYEVYSCLARWNDYNNKLMRPIMLGSNQDLVSTLSSAVCLSCSHVFNPRGDIETTPIVVRGDGNIEQEDKDFLGVFCQKGFRVPQGEKLGEQNYFDLEKIKVIPIVSKPEFRTRCPFDAHIPNNPN